MAGQNPASVLGAVVVELARAAAQRWAAGDVTGAEELAAGAWRLVSEHHEFVDGDQAADAS